MRHPDGKDAHAQRASVPLFRGEAGPLIVAWDCVRRCGAARLGQNPAAAHIEAELAAAHLPEPLVATAPTGAAEDAALLTAVNRYQNRANPDDFSALTGFLAAYPKSGWRVAVLANLGIVYLHYGYVSRALDAWSAAWRDGKEASEPRARALVDRAVGELVRLKASSAARTRSRRCFPRSATGRSAAPAPQWCS